MGQSNLNLNDDKKMNPKRMMNFLLIGIMTILITISLYGLFYYFKLDRVIEELELKTYDLRALLHLGEPVQKPSKNVMILHFDDATLNILGDEYGVWPWPRSVHADMIEFLNRHGARMIAYDIMFVSHQKGNEDSDQVLIDAFKREKNVYIGMNFDNNLEISRQLGKELSWQDFQSVIPLSIELDKSGLAESRYAHLDNTKYFQNSAMTFDHYRSVMPGFLEAGGRIGFLNHGRDQDGVSRSNPLFYRYRAKLPIETEHLPITYDTAHKAWRDAVGHPVTQEGFLLKKGYLHDDGKGSHRQYKSAERYFPYLGMRLLLDAKFPNKAPTLYLTKDNTIRFGDGKINYDVPLRPDGEFQVTWYNSDYFILALQEFEAQHAALKTLGKTITPAQKQDMKQLEEVLRQMKTYLANYNFRLQPYPEVPAWEVFRAMKNERKGVTTPEDQRLIQLLKDKVIFVGMTAVASYDIKTTSISKDMPGVLFQAMLFDNLLQNQHYMRRISPLVNALISGLLCFLAAIAAYKMRSALAGLLTAFTLTGVYIVVATLLFHKMHLWLNIAMPFVLIVLSITATFMIKYVIRDKDYEKTYAMATTDSMTGLYNHRFFKEHMVRSIEQSTRFNQKFSLVLIDIDFFKKFNDTYGHQAGDEVLRCVARKLKSSVRSVDVVCRYGGEEMAVILDRANEQEALAVGHKLVKAIADEAYPIAEGVFKNVTISVGVSTFPTHGGTTEELIEFSDQGLYRAKENGRNQVGAQYEEPRDGQAASA